MAATRQLSPNAGQASPAELRAEVEALRAQIAQLTASGQELISTQARMQCLLHRASDAIIQFESDATISSFNRAAERIFGYQEIDMLLQHGEQLFDLPERFRGNVPGFLLDYVASTANPYETPLIGRRRDGGQVLLEVSVAEIVVDDLLLFDDLSDDAWRPASSYDSALCILRDITERKGVDDELRRHRDGLEQMVEEQVHAVRLAQAQAERANHAKSEFIASIAHELRSPIHAIMSYSEFGLKKLASATPDRLEQYFSRIQAAGGRLLATINDLLDLSKAEAGRQVYDIQAADLEAVLVEVLAECEALAQQQGLGLVFESGLSDRMVACDAERIGQVVRNLVSNAIRFSPDGGLVRVSTGDDRLACEGHRVPAVAIEVSDQGEGLPEAELDSVFDRFVQGGHNGEGTGGTGLGLAISREIVRAHRGEITARNHPGGGLCLRVVIPRTQE